MTSTDEGGRRPKRRCAARSTRPSAMPSATHYVGYVEDGETPEMIMAKFAELERIQQAAQEQKCRQEMETSGGGEQPATDGGVAAAPPQQPSEAASVAAAAPPPPTTTDADQALTEEQLLEVFKQTSTFNVKTALQDNAVLMDIDEAFDRYGDDELLSDDDDIMRPFWSDDEDGWAHSDNEDEFGRRRGRRGKGNRKIGGAGGGSRLQRNASGVRARHSIVTAYNPDTQALVRRRVRVADPDEIIQVRIPPPPLPLPWGRSVRPYLPPHLRGDKKEAVPAPPTPEPEQQKQGGAGVVEPTAPPPTTYLEVPALTRLDPKTLPAQSYQAALINPGWDRGENSVADVLAKLPLPRLVPTGFIFIWTPKNRVQAVCKQMSKWGYTYIENLTWVFMGPNNKILTLPSQFVCNSHMTLYMFRAADKGRDIELRHQRNPDVTFDSVRAGNREGDGAAPDETFVAIETLLPTGKGKLVELWAPEGVKRPGWTHVVEGAQK